MAVVRQERLYAPVADQLPANALASSSSRLGSLWPCTCQFSLSLLATVGIPSLRRFVQQAPSVVSHYWIAACRRATRPRRTLFKMSSALAVQTKGFGSALWASR